MAKKVKATAKANAKAASAPAPKPATVTVSAAKGRPMLTWVGKRPIGRLQAYPAQAVERFEAGSAPKGTDWSDWPSKYPPGGLLFHGDNKEVLAHLLANGFRGKVQLIYIDPPFDSGADYVRKVSLRGPSGSAKVDGDTYTLGEQIQYEDIWANDNYLQFMYERLLLLKELMTSTAAVFLHCDWKRTHLLRCLLDEVFGQTLFRNEIIRVKSNPKNFERKAFGNVHDCVLYYVKGDDDSRTWNVQREELDSDDLERLFEKVDASGRRYTTYALHARGERRGETGTPWRGLLPPPGRHWAMVHAELDRLDVAGRIEWSDSGNPRAIAYADEKRGDLSQDIWTMKDPQLEDYPTEKPESLLRRIIAASSKPGDLVLDCFLGSGTTAAVAQRLGRRWIGCDINKGAIQTTAKRLQAVIKEQAEETKVPAAKQVALIDRDAGEVDEPPPAQLSFSVWRVNDYDLQVQHNEAVGLACEYLGVERTRTDRFFDGTRGRALVKIVPFDHPLSPVDIDLLKQELAARKDEDRSIVFVCLGIEVAAQSVIEEWNRLRRTKHAPNRIEVIELRHDPKHGGWLNHKPAAADVSIARKGATTAVVTIKDFISPTIVDRLRQQAGILNPKIEDCRAMIDSVAIDPAYDGEVLNVAVVDVPEKKADYVAGSYEVPISKAKTTVAVRITDMLGEEVLVTKAV